MTATNHKPKTPVITLPPMGEVPNQGPGRKMQLATIPQNLTMTSREIAELLEKQHNHIKVSADRLAAKGVIGTPAVREFTHNQHAHRMLQRSAAYLLPQASQTGLQRTNKSLWLKEEDDDSCLIAVCLTVGANATPRPTLSAWATG